MMGWLAGRFTPPPTLAAGAVLALGGGAFFLAMLPKFRIHGRAMIRKEVVTE
jgi:hypothetical protein